MGSQQKDILFAEWDDGFEDGRVEKTGPAELFYGTKEEKEKKGGIREDNLGRKRLQAKLERLQEGRFKNVGHWFLVPGDVLWGNSKK